MLSILVATKMNHLSAPSIKNRSISAVKEIDLVLLYSHSHKHFLLQYQYWWSETPERTDEPCSTARKLN